MTPENSGPQKGNGARSRTGHLSFSVKLEDLEPG